MSNQAGGRGVLADSRDPGLSLGLGLVLALVQQQWAVHTYTLRVAAMRW